LRGIGGQPDTQPVTSLAALVGSRSVQSIRFKNPLDEDVQVTAMSISDRSPTECQSSPQPLTLLSAGEFPFLLQAAAELQVSVQFTPVSIMNASCILTMKATCCRSKQVLDFRFPVAGTADIDATGACVTVQSKARQRVEHALWLELDSLDNLASSDEFGIRIQFSDGKPASDHHCAIRMVWCPAPRWP
jgi:hypothetical protein